MSCDDYAEHHVLQYEMDEGDDEPRIVTVFPREPSWWREDTDEAEQRRQHVFSDFDQSELAMLIDEVAMYASNPLGSADEVIEFVQRLSSLTWIIEVCTASLGHIDEADESSIYVRYWMGRAAKYLVMAGRLRLVQRVTTQTPLP